LHLEETSNEDSISGKAITCAYRESKIALAPHTQLEWHSHPMPSAAYIVAGELTIERKKDGKKQQFTAGQAVSETVDTLHRGVAGNEPVVLIVFYAGSPGVPVTQHPCR
jgi:quercetin dioxygenase-like cupin family protein